MPKATFTSVNAGDIEKAMQEGYFSSVIEHYLDTAHRTSSLSTYVDTYAREGEGAAERELRKLVKQYHLRVFADAVLPIARAVAAIARLRGRVIEPTAIPSLDGCVGPQRRFIVRDLDMLEVPAEEGIRAWHPRLGSLSLHAVVLETGAHHYRPISKVHLVVPALTTRRPSFAIFTFDSQGSFPVGERFVLNSPGVNSAVEVTPEMLFEHVMGIQMIPGLTFRTDGGSPEMALGFPGAHEYIAKRIEGLADYLHAFAEAKV